MNEDKVLYIECGCLSKEHLMVAELNDFGDKEKPFWDLSFHIQMNHWAPWWKRIWYAVKYAFAIAPSNYHWDSVMVEADRARDLRDLIDEYLKRVAK